MYAAGTPALEQREMVTEGMEGLLAAGFELAPGAPAMAPEAIGGALYAMLYDFVKANGPERLLELVPAAVYITLSPLPRCRGGLRGRGRLSPSARLGEAEVGHQSEEGEVGGDLATGRRAPGFELQVDLAGDPGDQGRGVREARVARRGAAAEQRRQVVDHGDELPRPRAGWRAPLGEGAAEVGVGGGELERRADRGPTRAGQLAVPLAGLGDRHFQSLPTAAEVGRTLPHRSGPRRTASPARGKPGPVSGTLRPGKVTRRLPCQAGPPPARTRAPPENGAGGLTVAQLSVAAKAKAESGAPA